MSAANKEKVLVELRKYHTEPFSERLATDRMNQLRAEFGVLEDKIFSMLLGSINSKIPFTDPSRELAVFRRKANLTSSDDSREDNNKKFFLSKIEALKHIIKLAKDLKFTVKIRRHRAAKTT